jgi:hypothetical protein
MPGHMSRDEYRAAAFREAAHSIAAWVAGREIIYIDHQAYQENKQTNSRWIAKMPKRLSDIQLVLRGMRDADDIGVTQKDLENYQHDLKAFGEAQIADDILIALAGSVAYCRIDKVNGETACAGDMEEAERLKHSLKEEDRMPGDELNTRAVDFVNSFETWIQSLAELLIERHRIEAKEFMEFIQVNPEMCEQKEVWKSSRSEVRSQ